MCMLFNFFLGYSLSYSIRHHALCTSLTVESNWLDTCKGFCLFYSSYLPTLLQTIQIRFQVFFVLSF